MNSKENAALKIIDEIFRSRTALLSFLREKSDLKLPKNTKTDEAIRLIIEKGKEKEFCQTIFKDMGFDIRVGNFEEAYSFLEIWISLSFFSVKELIQMAEELSQHQIKWKFKKRNKMLLVQSIAKNVTAEAIEGYVQEKIRSKEIPPIQTNKWGWILGTMGLLKSTTPRRPSMMRDMTKFLLKHVAYPTPYLELKEKVRHKLDLTLNKRDPLLKEKTCQLLLATLRDGEFFEVFNQLIDDNVIKITSIERYWNFVATPFGVLEPQHFRERNLAKLILKTFPDKDLHVQVEGSGTIEDLILQKCILEPPDKILTQFFGSGPYLIKHAKKLGLVGLSKIQNEKILVQSILLKLGFDVPPQLESIFSLASTLRGHLKKVKSGATLNEGRWNAVYNSLERILEDLVLFYGSVLHEQKLRELEEEEREVEIKSWIRKTFKLKKQFDDLTLGDLCALLRSMNRFSKQRKRIRRLLNKKFRRVHFVKEEHLQELDFIKGCRTELTKIHWTRKRKKCEQGEVLERLTNLLEAWISEKELSRTYPYVIRLKEEVTTEFGVRYYTVVDEEGRVLKLKTNEMIMPEDIWFMIGRNDLFPIDPVLVKKYW